MWVVHWHSRQLSRRQVLYKSWKQSAPTATHLVEYKEKETRTKKLVGKEATELIEGAATELRRRGPKSQ